MKNKTNRPMKKLNPGDCNEIARNRAGSRVSGFSPEGEKRFDEINWKSRRVTDES